VVRCAIPGCENYGFREHTCPACGEYHCPAHVREPIQRGRPDDPDGCVLIDPATGAETCFPCGNSPRRLANCTEEEFAAEFKTKSDALEPAIKKSQLRRGFGLLLLSRFHEMVQILDELEASPLEQRLWAGFIANGLDRYFDPQVEVYDHKGAYIVRVDFASTLLRMAVFTDGNTYHSSPAAVARDAEHNRRLEAEGWLVKRYWTKDITERLDETLDELYSLTAKRIWEMHEAMDATRS
jgi:very-short-patch-repair endonuclease